MTVTDAEKAFYEQVLADPEGHSIQDLRYAFFLAGANGSIPVVDTTTLSDGDVPVWDSDEGKWVPGSGGGGGGDVASVNGKTGAVTLNAADVGAKPADYEPDLSGYVETSDARLSDARTPLAHDHSIAQVTGLQSALDEKVGSSNESVSGVEYYPSVDDLPVTGVAGVLYFVDAE